MARTSATLTRTTPIAMVAATGLVAMLVGAGPGQVWGAEVVVPYTLDRADKVSAAVYDAQGRLVRELLHAAPQEPGHHYLKWDGRDREGKALPPGEYTWRLLQTPGLKATYLMSLGSNYPPGDTWATASGPGTHVTPFGVAVDTTGVYVSAETTENIETCMLKLAPDGKTRLWSALCPWAWDGAVSLAVDGGELFMLGHRQYGDPRIEPEKRRKQLLYVYDPATGQFAKRTVAPTNIGNLAMEIQVQWDPASNDIDGTDMDAYQGILVVAYAKRNALRWYDPQTFQLVDTAEVTAPQGVTIGAKGTVYVTTEDRIVRLSRENKTPVTVIAGLDKPSRLDVDHGSGDLLVYEAGTQQIKRFAADGTLRNTYGARGGRRDGLYDEVAKRSFAGFADLCADGAGGFYVTEAAAAPRRTAHFAADGSVLREWYGGQRWAPHAAPEPGNPEVVWLGSHYGWVMRVVVDYRNKTWRVHSCYNYAKLAHGLVGDSWNEGCYFWAYRHNGVTYLALAKLPTILKVDEKNWRLVPVTIYGGVANAPANIKQWAGEKSSSYQWNDANGDGVPQQAEFTFYEGSLPNLWEPYIAPDFSCFTASQAEGTRKIYRLPVTGWNQVGAPIYGTMPYGEVFGDCPPRFNPEHHADARWSVFMHQDPKTGYLYSVLNDMTRDWGNYDDSFMHQWSPTGESRWTVGQKGPEVGEIRTIMRGIAGVAHGCVIAIDNAGYSNVSGPPVKISYVWDRDGLFVGCVMDTIELKDIPRYWYQLSGEFCHSAVYELPDGDVLFYGNWENEVRVYRISGWTGWKRQSGKIRL